MTELKTLKDCYMSDSDNYEAKIREEAINWIKTIKTNDGVLIDTTVIFSKNLNITIKWIKYFFNITEEELQ